MHTPQLRVDIQLLRAIAVSMVLLFHAQFPGLSGGYLGVDVFLVISGYLITGLIARGVEKGRFRIADFYLNRAKRLLPASYAVYLVTGLLGLWLLTDSEFQRYRDTLLGALTFTANVTLWQGTNYFGGDAKFNVLLHVWSLSLEEQFYFLLPFAFVLVPRKFWFPMVLVGFVLSLLLCFLVASLMPVATFYLLPTRAWELLLGSIVALREDWLKAMLRRWAPQLGLTALGVLVIVPVFTPGKTLGFVHPSLDALLVTLATALVILVRPAMLNLWNPVTRIGYRLGNISYSLYLVHWPLFAFAENSYFGGGVPLTVRLSLLALSIGLAAALHIWIERPIHLMRIDAIRLRAVGSFVGGTIAVALLATGMANLRDSPRDYATNFQPNYGLSQRCDRSGKFDDDPACRTGDTPSTLVWGDSFAMHVARALSHSAHPFEQATMSGCAPALGIAQINLDAGQGQKWAEECIRFNDEVGAFISTNPNIRTVVLASPFNQVLGINPDGVVKGNEVMDSVRLNFETGLAHYVETVSSLVQSGRRVIVIGPTPSVGVNLAVCVERREMGLLLLGPHADCKISRDDARAYRESAFRMIERLRQIKGVTFIDLFDILCDKTTCAATRDDVFMFRDAGHLSIAGADYIREGNLLVLN